MALLERQESGTDLTTLRRTYMRIVFERCEHNVTKKSPKRFVGEALSGRPKPLNAGHPQRSVRKRRN